MTGSADKFLLAAFASCPEVLQERLLRLVRTILWASERDFMDRKHLWAAREPDLAKAVAVLDQCILIANGAGYPLAPCGITVLGVTYYQLVAAWEIRRLINARGKDFVHDMLDLATLTGAIDVPRDGLLHQLVFLVRKERRSIYTESELP